MNVFEARGRALRWLAEELGFDLPNPSIHHLTLDQCEAAIRHVEAFMAARRGSDDAR